MKKEISNTEKRKIEKRFETELGEKIEEELRIMEKNKGGAPMENTHARKDPSKKLSKQITIYTTEKSINNWTTLAKEAGLTTSKFVNHVMNKKRLPKEKSNPLIDNIL